MDALVGASLWILKGLTSDIEATGILDSQLNRGLRTLDQAALAGIVVEGRSGAKKRIKRVFMVSVRKSRGRRRATGLEMQYLV